MAFGVTDDGFVIKPLETIISELETSLKGSIDPSLNTTSGSLLGQLIAIFSAKISEQWELAEAIYLALDPDSATADALTHLATLTGTIRLAATKSTVTATLNLNNGTTVPEGSIVSVSGNAAAKFVTLEDAVNISGITANVSVEMEAQNTGVVVANSGTLTVIETPISGWNSATNAVDATLGTAIESDSELRIRRESELRASGAAAIDAIRADLLLVADVLSVMLFENDTDAVDGNGLPAHSIEALVLGGTDAAVGSSILDSKAAGIATYGSSSTPVVDDTGTTHTIYFSRPTEISMYIDILLTENANYPADGDTQVKAVIAEFADANYLIGDDVIVSQLYNPIFDVSGVEDVTSIYVYDNSSVGSESLSEIGFATHVKWSSAGGFNVTAGNAAYTHAGGTGSITQVSGDMAISGIANRWYKFTYTVSGVSGTIAASITTAFAETSQALTLTNGTHTQYFRAAAVPGSFVISATSSSGGFTLDDFTLKVLNRSATNFTIGARALAEVDTSRITVIST